MDICYMSTCILFGFSKCFQMTAIKDFGLTFRYIKFMYSSDCKSQVMLFPILVICFNRSAVS